MSSTREERMQQRLRGAQRRQIKDVDFGLEFPVLSTPEESEPSIQAASELELPPQPEVNESTPRQVSPQDTRPTTSHSTVDANTSAKRRKLDHGATPVTASVRRSPRLSPPSRAEGQVRDASTPQPRIPSSTSASQRIGPNTPPLPSHTDADESSMQQTSLSSVPPQNSEEALYSIPVESTSNTPNHDQTETEIAASVPTPSIIDTSYQEIHGVPNPVLPIEEEDELSPKQPQRSSRKRKSIEVGSPEAADELPLRRRNGSQPAKKIVETASEVESETETAKAINDQDAAILLTNSRTTRNIPPKKLLPAPTSEAMPSRELDASPKKTKRQNKLGKRASPARQRQPKKAQPRKAPKPKNSRKGDQVEVIPVTVHRFTRETSYDVEILESHIPFAKKGTVHAIDVLSQMCYEIVESGVTTLHEGAERTDDSELRREYKTKRRAVEAFGKELQTRLLEYTINLDATHALEKRVSKEQNQKIAYREEIMRVRHEREQVALRMDEIRIKHEAESKNALSLDTLNSSIHDIELAVEQSRASPAVVSRGQVPADAADAHLQLRRLAAEISNKSASGGILKRIKDFNAFLERTALALESKKT